ncbi:hypothetical protein K9N68_30025 [Kovacikia minuta CCNUW1]|uniref:hypothetical protein n=1 Tax=Kovacikia minuta TaxID=2931930 RepID=UPI001CCCC310|nr:hypothetical protein [Kovacikia minuta]UBF25742.1 hypothetical protein K9N68_30025 [Kovacikia minuta CCNUW1]
MPKPNKLAFLLILAIAGSTIFSAYSSLDSHFLVSSLILLPFQVGATLYLIFLYWSGQLKGTSRFQKQQQERKP